MPSTTITLALADALEDLSQQNFDKFRFHLLARKEEPRVRRNRVEGKNCLDITDTMVSTYTEEGALRVAVDILRNIGCNQEADRLVEEAGGLSSGPASGDGGAAGVAPLAGAKHFVDKHKVELIQRVGNTAPILDDLLDKEVLQQESYDRIRVLPTSQDRMRELYSGPLKAGKACKDIFYGILQVHEKFLIDDLTRK